MAGRVIAPTSLSVSVNEAQRRIVAEKLGDETQQEKPVGCCLTVAFIACCCIYPLGSQSMYDAPAAIGTAFQEWYQIDDAQFGFLYSMYALPNLIIVFLVGLFVDRVGPNWSAIFFNTIIAGGSTVMYFSGHDYDVLLTAFAFFGLGAGSILVSQMAILTKWFKGQLLAVSFGISTAILRTQSTLDYNLDPWLAEKYNTQKAFLFPFIVSLVAFGATAISFAMDHYRFRDKRVDTEPLGRWPRWSDVKAMPLVYWLCVFICSMLSMGDFLFEMYAVYIYEDERNLSGSTAGTAVSLASVSIVLITPISAFLGDRYGHFAHAMVIGGMCEVVAALLLVSDVFYGNWICYVCPLLFGAGYAISVSVMWAAVALVVDPAIVGTAYGIMNGFLNLALFILPVLMGWLYDAKESYFTGKVLILICALLGTLTSIALVGIDRSRAGVLYDPKSVLQLPATSIDKDADFGADEK